MSRNAELVKGRINKKYKHSLSFSGLDLAEEKYSIISDLPDIESKPSSKPLPAGQKAAELYQDAAGILNEVILAIQGGQLQLKLDDLQKIITRMIASLQVSDELLIKSLYSGNDAHSLTFHMLNVSILSLKLGLGLNFSEMELIKLGLAAIMHDIGKLKVSQDILEAPRRLSPKEFTELKKHSTYGYNIIGNWNEEYLWMAEIVLNIHEREDGSGYPSGRSNSEIHQYAKIIGLVDIYEALTHDRSYRKRLLHFEATRMIIAEHKTGFPKFLLKAFIQQLSAYPVNSYVKLNSSEIAQVIRTNPLSPLRPVIKVVYDSQGVGLPTPKLVNLEKNSLLYIISSLPIENFEL